MNERLDDFVKVISKVTKDSAEVVGNSLKVIYSRVLNAELNNIGIVTENKDVETVILLLASKWNTFNEKTKIQLAESIAGKYNLSKFLVLMDQLAEVELQQ